MHCHLDSNKPAHDVTSRAPISRNTTINATNKRARGIDNNGSHYRKGKTAKHEGPNIIKSPSMSTSKSRLAHAIGYNQGITDTTADVQIINYTAAVDSANDQYSNNNEARIIMSNASGYTDNSTTQAPKRAIRSTFFRKIIIRGSKAGSKYILKIPTSGNQVSPQAHIEALIANNEVSTQIIRELALHAHSAPD